MSRLPRQGESDVRHRSYRSHALSRWDCEDDALRYDTLKNFQHTIEARNQRCVEDVYIPIVVRRRRANTHDNRAGFGQSYTATYNATPTSAPITMGETTVFSDPDSGNGNLLLVQDATLSQRDDPEPVVLCDDGPAGDPSRYL